MNCTVCYINGEYIHDNQYYPVEKCTCECHKQDTTSEAKATERGDG